MRCEDLYLPPSLYLSHSLCFFGGKATIRISMGDKSLCRLNVEGKGEGGKGVGLVGYERVAMLRVKFSVWRRGVGG